MLCAWLFCCLGFHFFAVSSAFFATRCPHVVAKKKQAALKTALLLDQAALKQLFAVFHSTIVPVFLNMYDGTLQPGYVRQEHERVAADAIGKAESPGDCRS